MRPRMKSGGGRLLEVNALSAPFTLQRNAYAELEFPVSAFKFPIPLLNFPDPSRREFIEKDRLFHSVRSSCGRGFRLKSQEFPVFSRFNREPAETGSHQTPCSTTLFYRYIVNMLCIVNGRGNPRLWRVGSLCIVARRRQMDPSPRANGLASLTADSGVHNFSGDACVKGE